MANVKVTLDYQINDGMSLTFKAPCDSTGVTGLKVYYPTLTDNTETSTYKVFIFKDAHGNDLSNIGNLFTTNAYVTVVLDTTNGYAYIQNADTNGYLEQSLSNKAPISSPTFTGSPKAPTAATDYTTYRLRNMALVSSAPSSEIGNGQLVGVYS